MKLQIMLSAVVVAALAVGCDEKSDQSNTLNTSSSVTNSTSMTNANANSMRSSDTNVDNSKMNARDRGNTNLTALDQGNSDSDIKTSASIRKLVVSSTNNFSMTAQNIKIITQNGKVTLRGPVMNDTEKTQIESIAKGVAGDGNVENDLEVKANQ